VRLHRGGGSAEPSDGAIERGLAGPGLLAHVLVSKYCDHLPLYRQSEIYAREAVELERSPLLEKNADLPSLQILRQVRKAG
jgi:transposase